MFQVFFGSFCSEEGFFFCIKIGRNIELAYRFGNVVDMENVLEELESAIYFYGEEKAEAVADMLIEKINKLM